MTSASASRARTAVVPALYLIANVAIAISLLFGSTTSSLIALAVSAASLPFYWLFSRARAA